MKIFLALAFLLSPLFAEPMKVLGIGVPCVDYICQVDETFLENIELKKNCWKEVDFQTFSCLVEKAKNPFICTGGSAANTIKGLASLGVECTLFGNIGKDELGEKISDFFSKWGISPHFLKKDAATSQIACFVTSDGSRSFCSYIGPEKSFIESDLEQTLFDGFDLVHIEGYRLLSGVFFERALEMAKKAGIDVSIDFANAKIIKDYRERIFALLSFYSCIVFANEEEAFALTGLPPDKAALFLNNFCKIAVVKVGDQGCWVASGNTCFHSPGVHAKVLDTTGAGDLFASGFLYGYLNHYPLETCALFGNLAGSAVIENFGAEISEARWKLLKEQFKQIGCKQSPSFL